MTFSEIKAEIDSIKVRVDAGGLNDFERVAHINRLKELAIMLANIALDMMERQATRH